MQGKKRRLLAFIDNFIQFSENKANLILQPARVYFFRHDFALAIAAADQLLNRLPSRTSGRCNQSFGAVASSLWNRMCRIRIVICVAMIGMLG